MTFIFCCYNENEKTSVLETVTEYCAFLHVWALEKMFLLLYDIIIIIPYIIIIIMIKKYKDIKYLIDNNYRWPDEHKITVLLHII